ncbi:YfcZ/YiiS family protein [Bibersteinia trehalosi]|uniref:DNA mismatch repair protein n=3 Tax=Bibersteinia trehalosi TaxID=47735 RepID=W0RB54_BIBTR|nr:YfcZ/YiiS family protein [Bibersteinia trehalosi]AGH38634.1 DNA mismatch repair protein [Bibersteinia trehalosi USDA-ARS-USMARC-192]AHG86623.1 DNA mismatch repair protein [Bibersteinia trehalosi USDA-ARS-USMARC-190]OAQ14729.1 hypothetical protein F480_10425 [Bibersteinia trehalosi Y31]RRN04733.1 DUF406 family protein [Bibersteinia trehalosi]
MSECKLSETPACCCVDVGTVIDNSDRTVDFSQVYSSESEARDALDYLISKARAAESEPCRIESDVQPVENGYLATAHFEFAYQVEAMIFQLSTR